MPSIFEDPSLAEAFKREASSKPRKLSDALSVDVLDWTQDLQANGRMITHKVSLADVANLPSSPLRIIFAPLDLPFESPLESLHLFDHYKIPSAFLAGRLRSVTHSFGTLSGIDDHNCAWFHYLCKNITTTNDRGAPRIYDPQPDSKFPQLDHGDLTWIRSGYYLKWATGSNSGSYVTLICFGASACLQKRLQTLQASLVPDSIMRDPYALFVIILEELSYQIDQTVWDLVNVFRPIELDILSPSKKEKTSFTGLHNVAKHIIFLQESAESIESTASMILNHHQTLMEGSNHSSIHQPVENVQEMLSHVTVQFQSVGLRLKAVEKRMQNMIELSFHLVAKSDSGSMEIIALVTLVFLPLSTVSTIFGSQFFDFNSSMIAVSRSFWIFWIISVPLTLIVILVWHRSLRRSCYTRMGN